MTTNSQLSTTEPKKQKQKLRKQLEQGKNQRNGEHMEGYQWGGGGGEWGKGTGNKKHKWQVQNRQGKVKNSVGNGETKELIYMTHRYELRGGDMNWRGVAGQRGIKEGKWDNCNSIVNKLY